MTRLLLLLLLVLTLSPGEAEGAVRRFAVLVGNNEGAPRMPLLYFAEDDALKMQDVLTSVGGYDPNDVRVVSGGDRAALTQAVVGVRGDIAIARRRGEETLFLFYYSGHGDADRLHLGRSFITYPVLEDLVESTGADVRVILLDACQSGGMTRAKGAKAAPGFMHDVSQRLGATGQVIITSSTGSEVSQESDEIGGSYFTHFFVSGLLGAADEDGDELLTLAELYRYVYHETVFGTSTTAAGSQHPTFDWELSGRGDVVLADISGARSTMLFPPGMTGQMAIFDRSRRAFVAEVNLSGEGHRLALRPGSYLLQKRLPAYLMVARVDLGRDESFDASAAVFDPHDYRHDVARGALEARIRQAELPTLSLRLLLGTRQFQDPTMDASYIPAMPVGGAGARIYWRDGRWAGLDLASGAIDGALSFDGLEYDVPVVASSTLATGWFGFATRPRLFRAGAGLGLGAAYFRRDFPTWDLAPQSLFTAVPGGSMWLGWHPGRLDLCLEFRALYLPYQLDGDDTGTGFGEGLLTLGYRF